MKRTKLCRILKYPENKKVAFAIFQVIQTCLAYILCVIKPNRFCIYLENMMPMPINIKYEKYNANFYMPKCGSFQLLIKKLMLSNFFNFLH